MRLRWLEILQEILVIDDKKINTRIVALMLNEIGYTNVVTFHSALDTIAYMGINHHDHDETKEIALIYVDLLMPIMSGKKFCQAIRSNDKYKHTPIIITTGMEVLKSEVIEFGATDCLIKPITIEDLQRTTAQYIL